MTSAGSDSSPKAKDAAADTFDETFESIKRPSDVRRESRQEMTPGGFEECIGGRRLGKIDDLDFEPKGSS